MDTQNEIEIRRGLHVDQRRQAAEILYDAFQDKFQPIMRSRKRGIAVLAHDLNENQVLSAFRLGRLVGVAGLNEPGGRQFMDFRFATFVQEFGLLRGLVKLILFAPLAQHADAGELLLEAIAVEAGARGLGVGTALLNSVSELAVNKGYHSVRLEVIDSNEGARRLYERTGFDITESHRYPYLGRIFGVSGSYTMIKELKD